MTSRRHARHGGCLVKGLIISAIVLVVLALVFWLFIVPRLAGWAADGVRYVMVESIKTLNLPNADENRIIHDIDRLTDDYKAGRITLEQLSSVFEEIDQSPLFHVAMVYFIQTRHIQPSSLTPDQKEHANLAVQRFVRGLFEKTIPQDALHQMKTPVLITNEDGEYRLKEHFTDEELLALTQELQDKADAAGVPNEPFQVDIAQEFHDAIQRALNHPPSNEHLPEESQE